MVMPAVVTAVQIMGNRSLNSRCSFSFFLQALTFISFSQEALQNTQAAVNAAQKVIDGVSYLTETVGTISAKPTKMLGSWVTDQINPSYWVPNARIQHCGKCEKNFEPLEQKHHW